MATKRPEVAPERGPSTTNPWEILHTVRGMIVSERMPLLQPWLDLVGKQPPHERDALLTEGRDIWKYRMETVRAHLRQIQEVERGLSRSAVTVVTDDLMAETVYRPGAEHEVGYLVHRFDKPDDPPEWVERLTVGQTTHYPPNNRLFSSGAVLLPSGTEEYDNDDMLQRAMEKFVREYVHADEMFYTSASLYARATWMYDRADAFPYWRSLGDWGTGKSREIEVIGALCYRPLRIASNVTGPVVFRALDELRGTLVLDEADFQKHAPLWADLSVILNAGYQRGLPVIRMERSGDDAPLTVHVFDVYGPKVLAGREPFPDAALESRCWKHTTELREVPAHIPLTLDPEFRQRAQQLRNMLLLWRFRNYQTIKIDVRARVPGIETRSQQILQPILACVRDPALREAVIAYVKTSTEAERSERSTSSQARILRALYDLLEQARACGVWPVGAVTRLVDAGCTERERMGERRVGRRLTALGFIQTPWTNNVSAYRLDERLLARQLRAYGVVVPKPVRTPMGSR